MVVDHSTQSLSPTMPIFLMAGAGWDGSVLGRPLMLCRGDRVYLWVGGSFSKVVVSLFGLRANLEEWVYDAGVNHGALPDGMQGGGHDSSCAVVDLNAPSRTELLTVDEDEVERVKEMKPIGSVRTRAQIGKVLTSSSKNTKTTPTRSSVRLACTDRVPILCKALSRKKRLLEGGGAEVSESTVRKIVHKSGRCGVSLDGTEAKNFAEFASF